MSSSAASLLAFNAENVVSLVMCLDTDAPVFPETNVTKINSRQIPYSGRGLESVKWATCICEKAGGKGGRRKEKRQSRKTLAILGAQRSLVR